MIYFCPITVTAIQYGSIPMFHPAHTCSMPVKKYIKVIIPVKIGWEPYYSYWYSGNGEETDDKDINPENTYATDHRVETGDEDINPESTHATDHRIEAGDRVRVQFAGKEYIGTVSASDVVPEIDPGKIREINAFEKGLYPVSAQEIQLWRTVSDYYMCTIGEVYKGAYPAMDIQDGKNPGKTPEEATPMQDGIVLSGPQTQACTKIKEAFRMGKPALLKGVTGSGKTEIYIMLAMEAIGSGKNVLYLVPEIALGRQLEDRLRKVFGEMLMIFHSGETPARRRKTAAGVRKGQGYIVLGTRSALFLPHHDLGLVIVDEEHDSSYKQESPAPRYNGRDTAIMLAGIHGSNILLGSATPSLESLHNCVTGKFELAELDVRYHESEDADIEIIDTIAERKKRGMEGSFSLTLIGHIRDALSRGEQVMLFRARRAYSTALQCTVCGAIPKCPHCNVSLSWHKGNGASGEDGELSGGRMVCHYCGYGTAFTGRCPECGGLLKGLGAGTQKIEEETAAIFPEARIARLDSDSAQRQTYSKDVIRKFSRGEIDILIGTQMVTKGFDFPGLSLVAVLQADTLLSVQDFRADERAAQLLEQFRGRCGRRGKKGLFVIQTSTPEHPIYRILSGQETVPERSLLMERKMFGFPPYTRIVNICIRDTMEIRAERMGTKLAGILESGSPTYELTGPYSPAIDKVSDRFIRIIRLTLKKDRHLAATKRLLGEKISDFEQAEKYEGHIVIDVDPA